MYETRLLTELFTDISDGVCLSTRDGAILYLNPAAEKVLSPEFSPTSASPPLCDMLCARLAGCPPPTECPLRAGAAGAANATCEGNLLGAARPRRLRVRCLALDTPLLDSWEPHKIFTTIEDLSTESDLEARKEEWRRMIIHDLRSPLTGVYATLRLLSDNGDKPLEDSLLRLVDNGIAGCQKIMRLLQTYLDVSRLEEGFLGAHCASTPVAGILRQAHDNIAAQCANKRLQVELIAEDALRALADKDLLPRVLDNLLANAVRYSRAKDRIYLTARRIDSRTVEISVRDMGEGIAPADIPHVFERFYQAPSGSRRVAEGAGLGLAFCRLAVHAMGGQIGVASREGSGTEFYIRLPAG